MFRLPWRVVVLLTLGAVSNASWAEDIGAPLEAQAAHWLKGATQQLAPDAQFALRFDVRVGKLDSRLRLAACSQIEPYLPPGNQLWGRTRVGLRCVDGASRWNVSIPVTVDAYGPAWVLRHPLPVGAVVTQADVQQGEVNWAQEAAPVLWGPERWVGQAATRPLLAGQALRQGMVRPVAVFTSGTTIRVLAQGPGFQVATTGTALSAGVIGQLAKVQLDSGRTSHATVVDARTVRLDL